MPGVIYRKILKQCTISITLIGMVVPCIVVIIQKATILCKERAQKILTPQKISCSIKEIYNKNIFNKIESHIQSTIQSKSLLDFDPHTFYQDLKRTFPVIQSISMHMQSLGNLTVDVLGSSPICVMNKNLVVTQRKKIVSIDQFQEADLSSYPHITVEQKLISNNKLDDKIYNFIQSMPKYLAFHYAVKFFDPQKIELIPHTSVCKFRIIADIESSFDDYKHNALEAIFTNLCLKGYITKKMLNAKNTLLTFDFRLKNQVIVKFHQSVHRGKGL